MSLRYKPGSRCQQMWELWETKGPEAVLKIAPSLNLAEATSRSWTRLWEREKARGTTAPPAARKKENAAAEPKPPKRIKGYKYNPTGKRRVRCTYMTGRLGWLIDEGPEVSEVRWDDEFPEIFIINRFLKDAKQQSGERE